MKALSLWQPWASLIACRAKQVETRSWSTNYRGPLAIHAAKKRSRELNELCANDEHFRIALSAAGHLIHGDGGLMTLTLPIGVLVATCELIGCVPTTDVRGTLSPEERSFGDYSPGRFAWQLADVRALAKPVPFTGKRQLFNVPDELLDRRAAKP